MSIACLSRSDNLVFLWQWAKAPLRVASVLPSGRALARLITSEIAPETGPILELGSGTGVFTRALLARGVAEEALTLVESDPRFALLLAARFEKATILAMDATQLSKFPFGNAAAFGATISGCRCYQCRRKQSARFSAGFFRS